MGGRLQCLPCIPGAPLAIHWPYTGHTLAIHWPYTYSWLFTSVMGAWASTWLVATKWQPGNPRRPTSIQVRRIHFGDMLTCCHSLGGYRENGSNMRSRQLAGSNLRGRKRGAMLLPMSILWCGCRPKCIQYGLLSPAAAHPHQHSTYPHRWPGP
jgi:hypothetical protein